MPRMITPNTNISPQSIDETFIKDAAVTTVKIADANVTEAKIADGSITAAKIADGTIIAQELASDSVTTDKILDANVTTAKIADANVTVAKMAVNSVDSDQYVDGSIDTAHIGDDQITLAKISTSGASDNQILVYDHSSTSIVWETPATQYSDAEAIAAVLAAGNLPFTSNLSITKAAGLTTPLLKLTTTNSSWDTSALLLEDSNDDVIAIVGRNNTSAKNYQMAWTLDPNNTKPRTNIRNGNIIAAGSFVVGTIYIIKVAGNTDFTAIGSANNNVGTSFTASGVGSGTGTATMGNDNSLAGDNFIGFMKMYSNEEKPEMTMRVYGANNGFNIESYDDANGATFDGTASGNIGYQHKPIRLKGSAVETTNKFIVGQDYSYGVGAGYNNLQITSSVGDADGYQILQSVRSNGSGDETLAFASYPNGIKITPLYTDMLGVTKLSTVHSVTDGTFFVDGMVAMHPSNGKPIYYKHTAGGASRSSAGWKYFSDDSEV
jgi:hypothetical protein